MENKKFNKIVKGDLYCATDEKFVIQCSYSDVRETKDYNFALKLLDEHLKELHTKSVTVQLVKRISLKIRDIDAGHIDVPLLSYDVMLERINNPRKQIEKVWNAYLESFLKEGEYNNDTFNLRIKLFDLAVRDKDIIEKKIRQNVKKLNKLVNEAND